MARISVFPIQTPNGRSEKSTRSTSAVMNSVPKRLGLLAELQHQLGAKDPVGETGEVLDVGGEHELPAGADALDHDRVQVRPGGVDGRREPGRAGSDDDDVADFSHWAI